ncbi:hypothetical protein TNCV_2624391 [Trichonephila clavipes]|nr:hypothetical protein TNCV_2624391 [Trichonephila clavipes]
MAAKLCGQYYFCRIMNSNTSATNIPHCVEELMQFKSTEVPNSDVGVVWKFEVPPQDSSLSLDRGSKLRDPSPIALVLL